MKGILAWCLEFGVRRFYDYPVLPSFEPLEQFLLKLLDFPQPASVQSVLDSEGLSNVQYWNNSQCLLIENSYMNQVSLFSQAHKFSCSSPSLLLLHHALSHNAYHVTTWVAKFEYLSNTRKNYFLAFASPFISTPQDLQLKNLRWYRAYGASYGPSAHLNPTTPEWPQNGRS